MTRIEAGRQGSVLILFAVALSLPLAAGGGVEPRTPDERAICRVCGMRVAEHPEWIAQIVFADGSAFFFDGGKDLFHYLLARGEPAPAERGSEIAAVFVTSYYDLEVIPATSAWFVIGSDVHGPMGPELVPHATRAEAEEFQRDHRGSAIVRFEEVTAELLRDLR